MNREDTEILIAPDLPNSSAYEGDLFSSLSDLAAVHVTPIPPKNDTIFTMENSGLTNKMVFIDPNTGIEHNVPYLVGNDNTDKYGAPKLNANQVHIQHETYYETNCHTPFGFGSYVYYSGDSNIVQSMVNFNNEKHYFLYILLS